MSVSEDQLTATAGLKPVRVSSPTILQAIQVWSQDRGAMGLPRAMAASVSAHVGSVLFLVLCLFVLKFFGLKIPLLDPASFKERDIEFTLVEAPEAQPRNKNTKLRSTRATRAGGQKTRDRSQAEPIRAAGAPAPKRQPTAQPAPKRAAAKPQPQQPRPKPAVAQRPSPPTPRPQPRTPSQQPPTPQPPTPTPPAPKLPTPKVAQAPAPRLSPPAIKLPAPPTPKSLAAGPLVATPIGSPGSGSASGGSRSGAVGPSQIPGSFSGSRGGPGGGRPGGAGGSGGLGNTDQYGSPGGGGGRPGVDALPAPDYGAYMAELQRRIKRNWHPPSAQEDKRVVVQFNIGRDGRLMNIGLQKSSGYPEADEAALAAVRMSAPFRPLPPGHRDDDLPIQFTFDYNVYRSGGGGLSFR